MTGVIGVLAAVDTTEAMDALGLSEADLRAELAAVGVVLDQPTSDAQLDAMASHVLGLMAECDLDTARYREAMAAEVARIHMRYEALFTPIVARRGMLERWALDIAERVDYGKKKSRAVGNGTIGKRTKPERIEIVDDAVALAFAKAHPVDGAIKVTEKPVHKVLAPQVLALVHATGELPAGFEHHPESEEFYVKVTA